MSKNTFKTAPKPPSDFDADMAALWKDTCNRFLEGCGTLYRFDLSTIETYVRSWYRWQTLREAADTTGLYDERLRISEILKFEANMANQLKQQYRAIEGTVSERAKADQAGTGEQGGRTGVRQRPSREGVPQVGSAKKQGSAGVSWLDDARKKAAN